MTSLKRQQKNHAMGRIEETCLFSIKSHSNYKLSEVKDMSEQELKELDLNGEMLVRRENYLHYVKR